MKEAIRIGLDGKYIEPVLVPLEQTGVTPIYETVQLEPIPEGEEPNEPVIVGHIIAEKVPEGLYMPRWDFSDSKWIEGLTQEEIDEIRNAPQPETDTQKISRLEQDKNNLTQQLAQTNTDLASFMDLYFEQTEL